MIRLCSQNSNIFANANTKVYLHIHANAHIEKYAQKNMCAYLRQELDNEEATSDLAVHYKYKYIFRANMWPHVVSFLVTVTQTGKVDALEQFFRGAL